MKRLGDMILGELSYARECNVLGKYIVSAVFLCVNPLIIYTVKGPIGILFGTAFMLCAYSILLDANIQMTRCKLTEVINEMNDKERILRELQDQVEALSEVKG